MAYKKLRKLWKWGGREDRQEPGDRNRPSQFTVVENNFVGCRHRAIAYIRGFPLEYEFCVFQKALETEEMTEATTRNCTAIATILRGTQDPIKMQVANMLFNSTPSHWFRLTKKGGRGKTVLFLQGVRLTGTPFDAASSAKTLFDGWLKSAQELEYTGKVLARSLFRDALLYPNEAARLYWANVLFVVYWKRVAKRGN